MNILRLLIMLLGLLSWTLVEAKTPNPYKILGISQTATEDQVKKAFKKRTLKYHPDRNSQDPNASEKYAKVVNAY